MRMEISIINHALCGLSRFLLARDMGLETELNIFVEKPQDSIIFPGPDIDFNHEPQLSQLHHIQSHEKKLFEEWCKMVLL